MDPKRIVALVVGASVMVLIFSALLVPIINDATTTEKTLENTGYFYMEKYGTDEEVTIAWDPATPKKITVNGEAYNPNTPVNQFVNVAIGDNWYFRYADGGSNTYVQVSYGGIDQIVGSNSDEVAVTVTCSNGTATITKGTTTQTATYTELYVISGDEGEYIMKNATESVTVAGDTEFIGLGTTMLGTGKAVLKVTGNVEDGAEVTVIGSTPSGATVSDIEVSATPLTNYVGFALTLITFTISVEDTDYPATYSYFIVPAEVTLELAVHPDSATNALLSAIPIIVMIGIVLAVVGVAIVGRNDY